MKNQNDSLTLSGENGNQSNQKYVTMEQFQSLESQMQEMVVKIDSILKIQDFVINELFKYHSGGS